MTQEEFLEALRIAGMKSEDRPCVDLGDYLEDSRQGDKHVRLVEGLETLFDEILERLPKEK